MDLRWIHMYYPTDDKKRINRAVKQTKDIARNVSPASRSAPPDPVQTD